MENRFILTAFGKDREGIVADVTGILYENGCNLEDTSMTRLADEFTLILLFTSSAQNIEEHLNRECRRLEREKGISAFMRPLEARRAAGENGMRDCVLHVEGMDQTGIVYQISRHLAERKVNIIDLKSTVRPSPESGTAIYLMDIHIQVPEGKTPDQVQEDLLGVADELHVDITMSKT